ncbi:MAG: hypothetical protein ACJAXK_001930 [Yoonia sp.]
MIGHCCGTTSIEPFAQAVAVVSQIGWRATVGQRHDTLYFIVVGEKGGGFCKVIHMKHFAELMVNKRLRLTLH